MIIKRRFRCTDFDNNKNEDVIIDMNDMKSMFREYIMMKIDSDFENMIKKYFDDEIIGDEKIKLKNHK